MNRWLWGAALFSATLSATPFALSAEAEWTPSGELGFVNTTGNSEATPLNGKLAVEGRYEGREGHRAIESVTLDKETMHKKDAVMPRYAELIYNGYWFSKERFKLQKIVDLKRNKVTGSVKLKRSINTITSYRSKSNTCECITTRGRCITNTCIGNSQS